MALGVVTCAATGGTEQTFSDLCRCLTAAGWRVVGTLQQSHHGTTGRRCDMDVRILPDGPVIRINQKLGPGARGCRLDASALETAVAAVEREFARGADLLIVNKFGKHEAAGRGFRALIAEALLQDIPVICGLRDLNQATFEDFAGSAAEYLQNDPEILENWVNDVAALRVA
ncbi:hypothetical protein DEA8626_00544 [Defluviimonas aquaemixtae]|uniref:3-dehydroquinate dehydratase n=1 Tax=Albidovulum aquaemixtae TaxID=1542388 RepID=A0A2R8B3D3_9RHOB|nr:DUF2478 domain-containing protein [Defluviimonas aquaemixtae]SPH17030.1 hypothetical protein DEA8626_00544 [Defluviimonas aquaemixtae]